MSSQEALGLISGAGRSKQFLRGFSCLRSSPSFTSETAFAYRASNFDTMGKSIGCCLWLHCISVM